MAKINRRGKKIIIKIEDRGEASRFLRAVGFTDIPDSLDRAAEHRDEADASIPAAICASCVFFKKECRGIQNGCEDWTPLP